MTRVGDSKALFTFYIWNCTMSRPGPRHTNLPTHIRNPSGTNFQFTQGSVQSPLAARVAAKRAELAQLRDLRDASAQMAAQMAQLEEKLVTLGDGTEAVAAVLGNWESVLRAIRMASSGVAGVVEKRDGETPLPETLVRVPVAETVAGKGRGRE